MEELTPLYQISVECLCCKSEFKTSKVRTSFRVSSRKDTDFCVHYKNVDVNPEYYSVRVCPICGFSSTKNFSSTLKEKKMAEFKKEVSDGWKFKEFSRERTIDDALAAYKLALISAQIFEEKESVIANILHRIAWLYRYKKDEEQEKRFLKHALDSYKIVYERESVDIARLMYLIGEISRRLKNYSDAITWFSRVVYDKKINDSTIIKMSREQWAATRDDMNNDKIDVSNLKL